MEAERVETVIVGAGPAGLAVGACLRRAGRSFVILEKERRVGSAWRRHYERLHLHTDRTHSGLPHRPMPERYPRYPSRRQVVEYLEGYARHFELEPRFRQRVRTLCRRGGEWHTETGGARYVSARIVVATGYNRRPHLPTWPGMEAFGGDILHSAEYRTGEWYRDRRALVVGFGNSGAEIALDLSENGARTTVSVRGPVNIVPRDVLGIPILAIAIPLARLPGRLADLLTAPLTRLYYGDQGRLGLHRPEHGPFTQIYGRARIPVIDIGTVDRIRAGAIDVHPGIRRFTDTGVVFEDGTEASFDVVVLATGYRPAVHEFLEEPSGVLDAEGTPRSSGEEAVPGLYFCGFYVSPTGMLRDINIEARRIVRTILGGSSRRTGT